MATYSSYQPALNDNCKTTLEDWNDIKDYLPTNDKKIWCPFVCDLDDLSLREVLPENEIIHIDQDFFEYQPEEWDIVVDNPPFSIMPKILERLFELDKPFMILSPVSKLRSKYMGRLMKDKEDVSIIYPSFRFYYKYKDNEEVKKNPSFETVVICWKCGFGKENIWI